MQQLMKAVMYDRYGKPEDLQVRDMQRPSPGEDEILVRVRAVSVNSWDCDLLSGYDFSNGFFRPKAKGPLLGADIAGVVESTGAKITKFRPGDEVFGDLSHHKWGGFAEYALAKEDTVIHKPPTMTFDEAAALPQVGVMAVQGVFDFAHVRAGHKVLINGAAGGTGHLLIQMCKALGAEVTAVDATQKLDFLRLHGADHVIDYTKEDFAAGGQPKYDVILDVTAHRPIWDYRKALLPEGQYYAFGGLTKYILQVPIVWMWERITRGKKQFKLIFHKPGAANLLRLRGLFDAKTIRPHIHSVHPLSAIATAMRAVWDGTVTGKVVVHP